MAINHPLTHRFTHVIMLARPEPTSQSGGTQLTPSAPSRGKKPRPRHRQPPHAADSYHTLLVTAMASFTHYGAAVPPRRHPPTNTAPTNTPTNTAHAQWMPLRHQPLGPAIPAAAASGADHQMSGPAAAQRGKSGTSHPARSVNAR